MTRSFMITVVAWVCPTWLPPRARYHSMNPKLVIEPGWFQGYVPACLVVKAWGAACKEIWGLVNKFFFLPPFFSWWGSLLDIPKNARWCNLRDVFILLSISGTFVYIVLIWAAKRSSWEFAREDGDILTAFPRGVNHLPTSPWRQSEFPHRKLLFAHLPSRFLPRLWQLLVRHYPRMQWRKFRIPVTRFLKWQTGITRKRKNRW